MRQNFSFHVVSVSHHTTPVTERERFAFNLSDTVAILEYLRQTGVPATLLSTCNRCELYWSGPWDGAGWFHKLARERGVESAPTLTCFEGVAAVRHLFRVSAGLDSQILGETEILGQVRRAYDAARAAGTTTPEMDQIFSAALVAGRRARRETLLGRHPASVSSAAVDLVAPQWENARPRSVIVLGAGEAAEGVLRSLQEQDIAPVTLLNRKPEKAAVLAHAWRADVGPLEELDQRLQSADLLIVATASSRPVVTTAQLSRAMAVRGGKELLVIDLAVPRNVEPAARSIQGVQLFDLDDLQRLCCPAADTAYAGLAQAEWVIEDELNRLARSLRGRALAPKLAELHRFGSELAEQESAWALAQLGTLSETQREVVKQMAERLVRRVLYPVSRKIRGQ